MFMPLVVINMVVRTEYRSSDKMLVLFMACFGAQACLAGLFAATSIFTRTTFLIFGIALLPFFLFDYWFTRVDPVFNSLGAIDLLGNIIMLGLCFWGWKMTGPSN